MWRGVVGVEDGSVRGESQEVEDDAGSSIYIYMGGVYISNASIP